MADIARKPEDALQAYKEIQKQLAVASSHIVKVGIIEHDPVLIAYAAAHEFGVRGGNPERSFLRMPFKLKKKEIDKFISSQFKAVSEGKTKAIPALKLVGVKAENMIDEAFQTGGFGTWPDIKENTKKRKGSSAILIDTGKLRQSMSSIVVKEKGKK